MRFVIVESPFAGDMARNTAYARAALRDCLDRGEAPFASHLLYTQVLDDGQPEQRSLGIAAGLALGRRADATVVYADLGTSRGMLAGIEAAMVAGRPVEFRSLPGWEQQPAVSAQQKRILGIMGHAGAGKDTAADVLARHLGAVRVALADPLKRFCAEAYGFTEEQLWGPSAARNAPDPRYPGPDGSFLSPREALQTLGTEWGRRCYEDTWIDLGVRTAVEIAAGRCSYDRARGAVPGTHPPRHVVITDVRFPNELTKIRCAGGAVLRITRPGCGGAVGLAGHRSETAQDEIPDGVFDAVIVNDGTLTELEDAVLAAAAAIGMT